MNDLLFQPHSDFPTPGFRQHNKINAFLRVAKELSYLSTCESRHCGCVLTDRYSRIIGSGYNGIPSGISHLCAERGCARGKHKPGEQLQDCLAIHAEANALMHCSDIKNVVNVHLWGASPCLECAKLLCNSSAVVVYINEVYTLEQVEKIRPLFEARKIALVLFNGATNEETRLIG